MTEHFQASHTHHIHSYMQDGIVLAYTKRTERMAKTAYALLLDRQVDVMTSVEMIAFESEQFLCNETFALVPINVRGKTVFLWHDFVGDPDKALMSLLIKCDALRKAGAARIILMVPYFPYGRQDKTKDREPLTAKLVAEFVNQNQLITDIITLDLHADQVAGFFSAQVPHIPGSALFAPAMREHYQSEEEAGTTALDHKQFGVLTTDVGGAARGRKLAELLDLGIAIIDKRRIRGEGSDSLFLVGDVHAHSLIHDDIADTCGSIVGATKLAREKGTEQVDCWITHGVLSTDKRGVRAEQKLRENGIAMWISDSLPKDPEYLEKNSDSINVVSCAPLFAELTWQLTVTGGSVRETIPKWATDDIGEHTNQKGTAS